jgi:hypothetical protein
MRVKQSPGCLQSADKVETNADGALGIKHGQIDWSRKHTGTSWSTAGVEQARERRNLRLPGWRRDRDQKNGDKPCRRMTFLTEVENGRRRRWAERLEHESHQGAGDEDADADVEGDRDAGPALGFPGPRAKERFGALNIIFKNNYYI